MAKGNGVTEGIPASLDRTGKAMSYDQMAKLLAQAQEENERLREATARRLTMKVSEKGCLSLYGMGRFPVSLFAAQWEAIFENQEAIKTFIANNADKLSRK